MMKTLSARLLFGLGFGSFIIFSFVSYYKFQQVNVGVDDIWLQMVGALVVGMYFGVASLIFDKESWSPLKQTIIHFFLSVIVFFPIILFAGWIPLAASPMLICLAMFIVIYVVIWCLMYLYHRNQLKQLNNDLRS